MANDSAILHWSGVLTTSKRELSESEISIRYGSLLRAAVSAFKDDPSYVIEIAEAAASIRSKRSRKDVRTRPAA